MRDWIAKEDSNETVSEVNPAIDFDVRKLDLLVSEIGKVIKGKDDVIKLILVALISDGHVLVEDVPGIGKTTIANSLSRSLDLSFSRIQFTSDLLPSDVVGISVFNQQNSQFEWKSGPIFADIVLADEINRATPKTQSALLEAMAEKQVTSEGVTRQLSQPFLVIATQNPADHHGTYPLPESQLDRFSLRLHMGYPGAQEERELILDRATSNPLESVSKVLSREELVSAQEMAASVKVDEALVDYLLKIVDQTRNHPSVELGVSPRGALSLVAAAKALALLEGRDYLIVDDIKRLVIPCFAHRLIVNTSAKRNELKSRESNKILKEILANTEVPI